MPPDENLPALIGLPFPYRTSIPWVNSMSGVLYTQGLLLDLFCWSLFLAAVTKGLRTVLPQRLLHSAGLNLLKWSTLSLACLVVLFFFLAIERRLQWVPDLLFRCPHRSMSWGAFLR